MQLSLERLKEALTYCPFTGILKWRETRPSFHFKNVMGFKVYKARFGGKVAGHSCKGLNTRYTQIRLFDKLYLAHRLAWFHYYGKWPSGEVDHKDGDGLNNCIWNLRDTSKIENGKNSQRKRNNTSGVNGVYYHKQINQWIAEGHFTEGGVNKKKYLGCFIDIEDAATARKDWEDSVGGFTERHGK